MTLLALAGCDPPGVGARAHGFYEASPPVIRALSAYYADRGHYPERLDELVPRYLPRLPSRRDAGMYTLFDLRGDRETPAFKDEPRPSNSYELRFEYAGPGFNYCTYAPTMPTRWHCGGYY